MADYSFNVNTGETIARDLLFACHNTGTFASPTWSPVGKRTTDSSMEYDWGEETTQDILGNTYTELKKPVITQTFDPWTLSGGDESQETIHKLAVIEQNAQALANQDMLIVHFYTSADGAVIGSFAERYTACAIKPSSLGGEGGGNIGMPIDVTYGGDRILGTASRSSSGVITFTPDEG